MNSDLTPRGASSRLDRIIQALEWPLAICALAIIPALLVENDAATPRIHEIAEAVNWFVWLAFCADFALRAAASADRSQFIRRSWFDLLIVIVSPPFGVPEGLQALRAIRAARMLRLLRVFRAGAIFTIGVRSSRRVLAHRKFHYVLLVTVGVVFLGASGLYVIEGDQNPAIHSFGDALWWAASTTTTVGYGDVYPQTSEGRVIAMMLMVTGIGVIGIFTATIASIFISADESEITAMGRRLEAIERKMDRLLERQLQMNATNYPIAALSGEEDVV